MVGACNRREKKKSRANRSGEKSGSGTGSTSSGRAQSDVRELWSRAVRGEDSAAASACARMCDTLRGAEVFEASDGLDAFIAVAMGQNSKADGSGGLMVALAQALMRDMSDFKIAVFETLLAASRWPSLSGRIAGSGVLGVVVATLLAPRHGPAVKALMAQLCGTLTVDSPEVTELGDRKREEEFAKLRGQLISSGAIKALVEMVRSNTSSQCVVAASQAMTRLVASDAVTRKALTEAGALSALLAHVPGWHAGPSGIDSIGSVDVVVGESSGESTSMDMNASPTQQDGGNSEDSRTIGHASASTDVPATTGIPGGEDPPITADISNATPNNPTTSDALATADTTAAASTTAATLATSSQALSDASDDSSEDYSISAVLAAMASFLEAEGDDVTTFVLPLCVPQTFERLRAVVADISSHRPVAEQALRCLAALSKCGGDDTWCDPVFAKDLVRLIALGGGIAMHAASDILTNKALAERLGDLRCLRHIAKPKTPLAKTLQALKGCDDCGRAPQTGMLLCTGCRKTQYCSLECQKAGWKSHKSACKTKKKK